MKKKELRKLSKEELIEAFLRMQKIKDQEIDKLERKNAKLERKLNEVIKIKEAKNFIIKRENINKYCTKSEASKDKIIIDEADVMKKKHVGRKKGSKNFANLDFESIANETITIDPDKLNCEKCGTRLVKFNEDISYKITIVPRSVKVIKIIRPIYKCPKCHDKVYQALQEGPYEHSVCSSSLAANIIDTKYNLGVPLYRYSKYLNDRNIRLSTEDLSSYVLKTDKILMPLYEKIKENLTNDISNVVFADETPLRVLDLGKEEKKNGYIFTYISSFYNHPIYIYSFNKNRQTEELKKLLSGFKGYLVCDGYKGYDVLKNDHLKIQRCFAHIRRYFYDIVKTLNPKLKEKSKANEMVRRIDRLFNIESQFIQQNLSPLEIKAKRNEEAYLKIVNDIYDYLHSIEPEEGTPLEKAIKYFLAVEDDSKTFLEDGHIPISNNIAERAIKPFVICRKNFLFSKSVSGATASARLFSILQTAKSNALIPEKYFAFVIDNANKMKLEDLLPWSDKIPDYIKLS